MLIDAILGFVADFLRLIDVNEGRFWLKKGQRILHLTSRAGCNGVLKDTLLIITEGGDIARANADLRFRAGLPSPALEIL